MGNKINIIGLGAGDLDQLPLGIYRKLKKADSPIFTRTEDHPVVRALKEEGMEFFGFDAYYEYSDDFAHVYERIVSALLQEASEKSIIYSVPGHPMLAEKTVQLLLEQTEVEVEIIGGHSYLDDLFSALKIDPIEGFQFVDANSFERDGLNYRNHLVFCQVYDAFVASEVKLALLEDLDPDYNVIIAEAVGTSNEKLIEIALEDLDRTLTLSNLTTVYVPPVSRRLPHQFQTLREIIRTLRGPDGCPWDRKQTHETLREYAIEEVYELIDAINKEDDDAIIEELGDVLLQVMLHSQIGEDDGYFSIDDVIKGIAEKMIHRHPHVFGDGSNKKSWDELKRAEKKDDDEYLLDGVIRHAPSLEVAYELQKKAARVGFDWDNAIDMWKKFDEEWKEFEERKNEGNQVEMEKEFGDLLFVMANISRFYKINPEIALSRTNEKFIFRFNEVERQVRMSGNSFGQMTLEELDRFWDEAKRKEE